MVLSDFQMSEMKELFTMMDNLGPNTIQYATRMFMRSRVERVLKKCLPTDNAPFIESDEVKELFSNGYLEEIAGQGGKFFRIGDEGLLLKKKLEEEIQDSKG